MNKSAVMPRRGDKTRRILELYAEGWMISDIASELETPYGIVSQLLRKARRRGAPVSRYSRAWIVLSEDERSQLDRYSVECGVPPNRLARQIIVRAIDEGLVSVILGGDPAIVLGRAK